MLRDMPAGTRCFIDANIFYYHLVETPPLSEDCSDLLERVERGEVIAFTSAVAVAEATHKVMLAEAVARHGLSRQGLAHRLQRERHLIGTLSEHTKVASLLRRLAVHVESVTLPVLERAAGVSTQFELLTNDALTVAITEKLGVEDLATNDDDFDTVSGLIVWKPR